MCMYVCVCMCVSHRRRSASWRTSLAESKPTRAPDSIFAPAAPATGRRGGDRSAVCRRGGDKSPLVAAAPRRGGERSARRGGERSPLAAIARRGGERSARRGGERSPEVAAAVRRGGDACRRGGERSPLAAIACRGGERSARRGGERSPLTAIAARRGGEPCRRGGEGSPSRALARSVPACRSSLPSLLSAMGRRGGDASAGAAIVVQPLSLAFRKRFGRACAAASRTPLPLLATHYQSPSFLGHLGLHETTQ
jgi:hypothetical protein